MKSEEGGGSKAVNKGPGPALAWAELITLISSIIAYIKPVVSRAGAVVRVCQI